MKTILREVELLSSPEAVLYCSKCNEKTAHVSSGQFRINAQRQHLDIWLIYRCPRCKATWNLTLFTRVNPKRLPPGLLDRFTENDSELAMRYACDAALLRKNGAEPSDPEYRINDRPIEPSMRARIVLFCRYPATLRLSKLLREILSVSGGELESMAFEGIVRLEDGGDIMKRRLNSSAVIILNGAK